jgi:heavy metal efflux system protein
MDEGSVLMQLTKHPSIGLGHSVDGDMRAQQAVLQKVPEVTDIIARVGSDELGLDPMSLNETDSFMKIKPRNEWRVADKAWLVEEIRTAMESVPGIQPSFTQPIEMRVSEMLTGSRGDLAIKIFGPDLKELGSIAQKVQQRLEKIRGATEVITVANDRVDYLQLEIDRLAMGRAGMPVETLQDTLRSQVEGVKAGVVAVGLRRVPIVIRGDPAQASSPEIFAGQTLRSPDGQLLRVADVATLNRTEGPVKLEHENGSRFALVQAFVSGRDLVGYVEDAKADVAKTVPLPPGYRLQWGGQFENQQRASARLMIVLPIALIMIFVVLFITLRSARASLLILANIPFAMVGGIVALLVTSEYLSVPASVGFIALLGIAVLNGLVMVSYFRQLRENGLALIDAVRRGAERRLRPVLMTAAITAFGLVPLLFASGPGSEIQKPLAIVVIGGLITSTMLTLILLPLLYERFGEAHESAPNSSNAAEV